MTRGWGRAFTEASRARSQPSTPGPQPGQRQSQAPGWPGPPGSGLWFSPAPGGTSLQPEQLSVAQWVMMSTNWTQTQGQGCPPLTSWNRCHVARAKTADATAQGRYAQGAGWCLAQAWPAHRWLPWPEQTSPSAPALSARTQYFHPAALTSGPGHPSPGGTPSGRASAGRGPPTPLPCLQVSFPADESSQAWLTPLLVLPSPGSPAGRGVPSEEQDGPHAGL